MSKSSQYGNGHLRGPTGIAIDQDGYCLDGDYNGKSLTNFDSNTCTIYFIQYQIFQCGELLLIKTALCVQLTVVIILCINTGFSFTEEVCE